MPTSLISRANGQALLEYVVATGVFLAATAILALLVYAFKEQGGRMLELIAADFP